MKKIYVPKSKKDKLAQRKYFFWYKREYRERIMKELSRFGRKDLIASLYGKNKVK
jgi:hypothetical protein